MKLFGVTTVNVIEGKQCEERHEEARLIVWEEQGPGLGPDRPSFEQGYNASKGETFEVTSELLLDRGTATGQTLKFTYCSAETARTTT